MCGISGIITEEAVAPGLLEGCAASNTAARSGRDAEPLGRSAGSGST
jgi:hypothetical protein